jgi:hypothetical protein
MLFIRAAAGVGAARSRSIVPTANDPAQQKTI